eukprot:gb/GFBE01079907.1/.p1 GENE.gb/GFBE01079907.1/~~gb/GFBE01079907.1/.p1  ORF type:complete len:143 (+),score=34.80 gb/GFBE01079907.1/:1-429(+)
MVSTQMLAPLMLLGLAPLARAGNCEGYALGQHVGSHICYPDKDGSDYGKRCMKTLLQEGEVWMMMQGCDGATDSPSLCEEWSYPEKCCKLPLTGQKILCAGEAKGFFDEPEKKEFDDCEKVCEHKPSSQEYTWKNISNVTVK